MTLLGLRPLLAALLLLALPASAHAQATDAAADVSEARLEPASGEVRPGGMVNATLVLTNGLDRPVLLALGVDPAGAKVALERNNVSLPAHGSARVRLTLGAPAGAAPGERIVTVTAEEKRAATVDDARAPLVLKASYALRVLGPPPPVSFRVEPEVVDVPVGGQAVASLVVTNGGKTPVDPRFEVVVPAGLRGSLGEAPAQIPAGVTLSIPFLLEAAPDAREGDVLDASVQRVLPALAADAGPVPRTPFRVRLVAPVEPPPEETAVAGEENAGLSTAGLVAVGAAGLGGAAGLVAWLHRRWPLAFVGLYTRLKPSSVLAQPLRERIAETVRARPGVSFGELKRELGMGAGTLTHHSRVLEDAGVLFSTPDGQTRRFYLVGHGRVHATPPLDERALSTLRERGPMSASDLAKALGVSRQSLHYHLKRMLREGRLVGEPRGRELWVRAPAPGPAAG